MIGHVDTAISVYGAPFLHEVNAAATFFNIGTHRLRMMMSCRKFVEDAIDFCDGKPLAADLAFAAEMVSFLCPWADVGSGKKRNASGQNVSRADRIRKFFQLIMGGYDGTRIKVYTGEKVTVALKDTFINDITEVIWDSLVQQLFPVPSTGKWTKTGPCMDRLMLGNCCNILRQLADRGLTAVTFSESWTVEGDDESKELDATFEHWNAVGGVKKQKTMAFMHNRERTMMINEFQVTDESYRYLTRHHLHMAYRPLDLYEPDEPTTVETYTNERIHKYLPSGLLSNAKFMTKYFCYSF